MGNATKCFRNRLEPINWINWNLNTETGLQSFPKMKFVWKYYALAEKIL